MFDTILYWLETLAKYGVIDIVFGVGIFALLAKLLKRKKVSEIKGIDLIPHIDFSYGAFILMIKNQSQVPLYLYKAYIKPGYFSVDIDHSILKSRIFTLFFKFWKNDRFPKAAQRKTTKGLYILQLIDGNRGLAPTLFIEPYHHQCYKLDLDRTELPDDEAISDIFDKKQFGLLQVNFVHGTKAGFLEVQL